MSVTGTSFRSKTECFVLQCVAENEKQLQNEHQNSTRDAKSKSETSGKKMSKKTVVAAILLILGFSGAIAYIGNRYHQEQKYCYTKQCKRSEKKFLESVNFDVKPCDNFYEFVCGNWKNHHPIPDDAHNVDAFYELQQRTTNEIANFLKHKNSKMEPEAVHSARALFKSCLRAEKLNKTNRFEQIADVLIDVNLPPVPSFTETSENFSWPLTAVLSKKLYNHNFFFEFTTTNDPKNHSIYRLSIVKPSSINPLSVNRISQKKVNSENQCYSYSRNESYYQNENETEYFIFDKEELLKDEHYTLPKSILTYIYKEYGLQWTDEIEDEFYEMVNPFFLTFERDVQILVEKKTNKSPNLPEYITIDELQELTDLISECHDKSPIIYWKSFFHWMFEDIPDVELDFEDRDREIVLMDREYLIEIMKLIASTPPYVIEFYMWWKTVSGILPFTNSILNEIYNEITENEKPRNEYCAEITNEILGFAAAHFIIYDKTVNENMKRISEMVESIQQAFLDEMKNVKWMDEETRKKALQKLGAMKKRIGYPAWMNNTKDYDEYYAGIVMDEDDFFSNVVRYHRGNLESMLNGLHVFETEPTDGWDSKPLEVNAYFNIDENTMIIPAGMFPYPFYHLGLESLNYGAIGVVIGHEMIHGFDNTGKEYDKDGHLNPWWTNETRMEYQDRATCFINHYSQFNFSEIENAVNTTSLSGIQTLDENIADNGGLRIAFYAYKDFVAKNGPEKRLPTLKEYTNEQMFFLSFAHTWCEHSTSEWLEETLASDEHSPHFVRVLATLMNSKEFAKAWECPKGSPMNPEKHKCEMW